jgi:hypothetical protein
VISMVWVLTLCLTKSNRAHSHKKRMYVKPSIFLDILFTDSTYLPT